MTEQAVKDITQTPEFKSAVAEAAAKAASEAIAQLTKAGSLGAGALNEDATALFSKMALAIAEISDQGSNRKRVAPEILAQREASYKRCVALVTEAQKKVKEARDAKDREKEALWLPEYRLVAKTALNERLIEPFRRLPDKTVASNEIVWTGIPNEAMRPINDIAKRIFTEFKGWIGSTDKLATSDNRPHIVTAGGLVVKGDPPKRREGFSEDVPKFNDDLEIKHDIHDPSAPFVHVLGTIASPARQNVQENQKRS